MAELCAIAPLEYGTYMVAVRLGDSEDAEEDAEECSVEPLASKEQAELVCDLLTIRKALEEGQPLSTLQLRSQPGPPSFQLTPEAAELIGSTDLEGLVAELQDCAEELQDEYWHFGASPGCSAAGMLLLVASALSHACTAQLLLLLQPDAAAAKGGAGGGTPLVQAAKEGHLDVMKAILAAMPAALDVKTDTGCTALHHAASNAQCAAVQLLLEAAPATAAVASTNTGGLALHLAAADADKEAAEEMVRLLLAAAPETATAVDSYGDTPLQSAVSAGNEAAVRLLLAAAPEAAMWPNNRGRFPIHCAAMSGNTAAVQLLLAARPGLVAAEDSSGRGWTAAHYAASVDAKGVPALQLLLTAAPQACVEARDAYGWNAAHVAARHNCPAALSCLLTSGSAAQQALAMAHDGCTPLHLAAECSSVEAAQVLLEVAPEACMVCDSLGVVPLAAAVCRGSGGMVSLLLGAAPQAALERIGNDGALPIHIAAAVGEADVVSQLLAACPETATVVNKEWLAEAENSPLESALLRCQDPDKRAAVARILLPAMPAHVALHSPSRTGPAGQALLPDFVAAHLPLTTDLWELLPNPCPGLAPLLPAALAHGTKQARQLVQHMTAVEAAQLRLFALCLARAQRRTRVHLPPALTGHILSLFDA